MQCIARFKQGLAVTELEVVTLALASLNAIMSFFWWNKPLGLTVPMKVQLKHKLDRSRWMDNKVVSHQLHFNRHHNDTTSVMQPRFKTVMENILEKFALRVLDTLWHDEHSFLICCLLLPTFVLILLLLVLFGSALFIARSLYTVMVTNTIASSATHVPAFYSPKSDSELAVFRIIFPIFGAVFGGLHCLGWSFMFPTQAEQKLWQVASLTITIIPVYYGLFSLTNNPRSAKILGHTNLMKKAIVGLLATLLAPLACVYVLARLALFVEALVLLRNQPSTAFLVVDWTKYLPNINV